MEIFIETERLLLRELLPSDAAGMFQLDSDADVHRYLGKKPVKTIEECVAVIGFIRQQYAEHGIGRWAVVEKATGDFIGWAGWKFVITEVNGHSRYYDLGYRFIKKYWGQGYATEAAVISVDYGLNTLRLKEIYAMTDAENAASKNVLQKVGFTYTGDFLMDEAPHSWFELNY